MSIWWTNVTFRYPYNSYCGGANLFCCARTDRFAYHERKSENQGAGSTKYMPSIPYPGAMLLHKAYRDYVKGLPVCIDQNNTEDPKYLVVFQSHGRVNMMLLQLFAKVKSDDFPRRIKQLVSTVTSTGVLSQMGSVFGRVGQDQSNNKRMLDLFKHLVYQVRSAEDSAIVATFYEMVSLFQFGIFLERWVSNDFTFVSFDFIIYWRFISSAVLLETFNALLSPPVNLNTLKRWRTDSIKLVLLVSAGNKSL